MSQLITSSAPALELKAAIEARTARVGVIGLGYVGLPLALLYTEQKFRVTGFDIDKRKVETLTAGGLLYLPYRKAGNPGGSGCRFFGHFGLRQADGDGRHHHLRTHPA